MRIFDISRGYLNFKDLCASRPVCKSWANLKTLPPHPYPVYFFEDGSDLDLPDSDDQNYQKVLLNASIRSLHCQIFTEEQLGFVLQLMPSLKEAVIEICPCESGNFYMKSKVFNIFFSSRANDLVS